MKKHFVAMLAMALGLAGCGPSIYKSSDFTNVASTHKTVAIIPADVMISLRPNEAKKITPEQLEQNQSSTGYAIQEKMYGWFLRRSNRMHYTVNFQDVSKTNALLQNAHLTYKDLKLK